MISRLQEKLAKTRNVFKRIGSALAGGRDRDQVLEELSEALILADVGVPATERIVGALRRKTSRDASREELLAALKAELLAVLSPDGGSAPFADGLEGPAVVLMVGANGGGKTTSAAKLAARARKAGRKVVMAAADTFRAAAREQLAAWGKKLDVPVVKGQYGADPASVVFDAVRSFKAQAADLLLVDTAGRIHTNLNLMNELEKIRRVAAREAPEAGRESLLVLDACFGQNALVQAREFLKFSGLTGVFLTKVDGTARGGVAVAISSELGLPVRFLGVGEQPDDIEEFEAREFVEALLE